MPRGILASLAICTVLYVAAALVLTGMIPYSKLVGVADPLAAGFAFVHQDWAAGLLAFGAVIALTSVLLVFQLGQPRILMAMSRDGLLSPWFSKIHPRYRTPHVTTILTGIFVAFFSAIANIDEIVQLTNIGTLFAFILVAIGILILRVREPDRPRKFRVPFSPVTPVLGDPDVPLPDEGAAGDHLDPVRPLAPRRPRPLLRLRDAAEPPAELVAATSG